MSNMVNKLKYNVDDVVTLKNGENAIIVDIVDGGHYRVKSDSGLVTISDNDIQNEQLKESAKPFDYADYDEIDKGNIKTVKDLCNYLIPNKSAIWNKNIGAPVVDIFKRFEPKSYTHGNDEPYYARFDGGTSATLTHLLEILNERDDVGLFMERDTYEKMFVKKPSDDGDWDEEESLTEGKLMKYAKEFFKKMKTKKELKEGLQVNDMEYLVSPYVSVDEYTSKIDQDDITIAFFCNEKEVATDLRDFLEKMYYIEIRDIEISDSLTEDNKYILFVEIPRNTQFPKILVDILDSIGFLINKELKDWQFITLKMNSKKPVSIENLTQYVRLQPMDKDIELKDIKEEPKEEPKKEVKKESVEYSKGNITRKYIDEGYVTEEEMNKIIDESETLDENVLDIEVLEYNIPQAQVFSTDNNLFVVTGSKIKKLGF